VKKSLVETIWSEVQKAQARHRTGSGFITETRNSKLFSRPRVFKGRFFAVGMQKFRLEYSEPDPVVLIFNEDHLNVTTGTKPRTTTEVLRIGEHVRRAQKYFSREASLRNLQENFSVTADQDNCCYQLRLVPKTKRFKERLNYVIIRFEKGQFLLKSIEIDGTSGVNSRFDIDIRQLNQEMEPDLFKVYKPQ